MRLLLRALNAFLMNMMTSFWQCHWLSEMVNETEKKSRQHFGRISLFISLVLPAVSNEIPPNGLVTKLLALHLSVCLPIILIAAGVFVSLYAQGRVLYAIPMSCACQWQTVDENSEFWSFLRWVEESSWVMVTLFFHQVPHSISINRRIACISVLVFWWNMWWKIATLIQYDVVCKLYTQWVRCRKWINSLNVSDFFFALSRFEIKKHHTRKFVCVFSFIVIVAAVAAAAAIVACCCYNTQNFARFS